MDYLNSIDTQIFLFINGLHNDFFDFIMYWLSDKLIWIPLYLFIVYIIIKEYKVKGIIVILMAVLVITMCDQTASHLLKNTVKRLRPSHVEALAGVIHLTKAGVGGLYGFASSHAANTFGLATFVSLILSQKYKVLKYSLFVWAILVSYSRVYNGVHYPGDVLAGAVIGIFWGWAISKLYLKIETKWLNAEKK